MTSVGFILPDSKWYFSMSKIGRKYIITLMHGDQEVVEVEGTKKGIALERAWDALQEYCFGRKKVQ